MPISKEIEKEKVIGIFPCKKKKNNNYSAANFAPFFNLFQLATLQNNLVGCNKLLLCPGIPGYRRVYGYCKVASVVHRHSVKKSGFLSHSDFT